jgi:hypothetical protein
LEQGEILKDVYEHRPKYPSSAPPEGGVKAEIIPIHHSWMVVMHPWCDLDLDFKIVRFPDKIIAECASYEDNDNPTCVNHVILCDAYLEDVIKARVKADKDVRTWKWILENDHKRYHYLNGSTLGEEGGQTEVPGLILDFKRVIMMPAVSLYEGIRIGGVKRVARVAPVYLHEMCQRFYAYLSRVGLPD